MRLLVIKFKFVRILLSCSIGCAEVSSGHVVLDCFDVNVEDLTTNFLVWREVTFASIWA